MKHLKHHVLLARENFLSQTCFIAEFSIPGAASKGDPLNFKPLRCTPSHPATGHRPCTPEYHATVADPSIRLTRFSPPHAPFHSRPPNHLPCSSCHANFAKLEHGARAKQIRLFEVPRVTCDASRPAAARRRLFVHQIPPLLAISTKSISRQSRA